MSNRETGEPQGDNEPLILALDTSSKLTSMAIARGEKIIATFGAELDETRSTKLWNLIDYLLEAVGVKIEAIDLYAVCTGPGGFTGLRVGMAATQAFAAATGKLTVGVSSLEAWAAAVPFATTVCSMLNAYKGEVYSQLFELNERREPLARNAPEVSAIEKALERVAQIDNLVIVGDGAHLHHQAIKQFSLDEGSGSTTASPKIWRIHQHSGFLAEEIARLGFLKMQTGAAVSAENLQATYVRGADIKIKVQG
ncbi:MAG: tRNA (adenosine(37)-N6)-threonylcarbamoyltransferase complex dimerization subunit type 1 TsaB [Acidobacteriota bacterium]